VWQNVQYQLSNRDWDLLASKPQNLQCHILGKANELISQSDKELLGLGLNYCINSEPTLPHGTIDLQRFEKDVRTKIMFAGSPLPPMPKLFTPNMTFQPDELQPSVKNALREFEEALKQHGQAHRSHPNITREQKTRLRELKQDERIVILPTDKNLGPSVLDTETYIDRALQDHLLNETNYRQLSQEEADHHIDQLFQQVIHLTDRIVLDAAGEIADEDDSGEGEEDPDVKSLRTYFARNYKLKKDTYNQWI